MVMKYFPQKLLLSSSFIHNLKSNYKKVLIDFILLPSFKNTKKLLKSFYLSFYHHYWKKKKSIRNIYKISLDLTKTYLKMFPLEKSFPSDECFLGEKKSKTSRPPLAWQQNRGTTVS